MPKHVCIYACLAAVAALLLLPAPAMAQDASAKAQWAKQWLEQSGYGQQAEAVSNALKQKYGATAEDTQGALHEKIEKFRIEHANADDRKASWEAFKNQHADLADKFGASEEERKQKWEEWKASHQSDKADMEGKKETIRQKWDEYKMAKEVEGDHAKNQRWQDFKYHNREEAIAAWQKYKDWQRDNGGSAEGLKTSFETWRANRHHSD